MRGCTKTRILFLIASVPYIHHARWRNNNNSSISSVIARPIRDRGGGVRGLWLVVDEEHGCVVNLGKVGVKRNSDVKLLAHFNFLLADFEPFAFGLGVERKLFSVHRNGWELPIVNLNKIIAATKKEHRNTTALRTSSRQGELTKEDKGRAGIK